MLAKHTDVRLKRCHAHGEKAKEGVDAAGVAVQGLLLNVGSLRRLERGGQLLQNARDLRYNHPKWTSMER